MRTAPAAIHQSFRSSARAPGAKQQFAAELDTPYIEVTFELHASEDAEHKIRTFCGLEEISSSTQHSLLSALHTLLQDDVRARRIGK